MIPLKLIFKNQFGEESVAVALNGPGQDAPVIFGGEGVPDMDAPLNTLYLRTDAADSNAYLYRNTDGEDTWEALIAETPSGVLAIPLTGFSAGAGTVSGTDTILQGFNKLVGNTQNKAVTANLLTGLAAGSNTAILSTDTILVALANLQAQITALA